MKKSHIYLFCFTLPLLWACQKTEDPYDPSQAYDLLNVTYGSYSSQNMDIYLPANRSAQTKVLILVHGGGWTAGSKEDFNFAIPFFKTYFPSLAVVNINYRLGTWADPGYPKQIQDIQSVISFLQAHQESYHISSTYAFYGSSAGGHLSLLYSYAFDPGHQVKVVCSQVGPTDFTDTSYINNPVYDNALFSLVGTQTYLQNPSLYAQVSPAYHVSATSPKTILFYGDSDSLVPATQGGILHNALTSQGVYNEFYLYPGEGHGNWSTASATDAQIKLVQFLTQYF